MDGLALILAAVAVVVAFRQRRRIAALQATLVGLADAVKSLPDGSAWYDSTWNLWSLPRLSR